MEVESNQEQKAKKRKLWVTVTVILAVIVFLVAAVWLAVNRFLNSIDRIDPNREYGAMDPGSAFEYGEPVEENPVSDRADAIFADDNIINILLAGQDRRAWDEEGPQRTDAMVLCTVNLDEKTVIMTSFLCDLWVYVPDLYNQRLNMPYKLGGFPLLNDTLEYNFGVRADYNVEMDFEGFMQAIDAVGGVEIYLTAAEANYLNQRGNWGVKSDPKWQLKEGANLLNGSQALAYTRINQLGTDFGRANRHHAVLTALFKKLENIGSTDLLDLSREILPLISTDMSDNQILELLLKVLPLVSELEIKSQHIPISGQYELEKKGEAEVFVMSREQLEENKQLLKETLGG